MTFHVTGCGWPYARDGEGRLCVIHLQVQLRAAAIRGQSRVTYPLALNLGGEQQCEVDWVGEIHREGIGKGVREGSDLLEGPIEYCETHLVGLYSRVRGAKVKSMQLDFTSASLMASTVCLQH